MSASKLEAGQLIIEAFKAALDTIDNFVGNDGPSYERAKRGLDVAEEFFRTEQPQPAEDPDEWVIQDRVPIRDGIDQGRYQQKETRPAPDAVWYALADMNMKTRGLTHGATHPYDQNCMLFVRCRRRDLPSNADWSYHNQQKPQPKKRMLRLWVDSDCNVHAGLKGDRDLELHYDHETRQFYTEEPS